MTRLTSLLAIALLLVSSNAAAATSTALPTLLPTLEAPIPLPTPPVPIPQLQELLQATDGIVFEANVGQWDPTALFRVHAQGYDAFITRTGMAMVQVEAPPVEE